MTDDDFTDGNEDVTHDEDTWYCPYCGWSGEKAPINAERWEIECPECGSMIDDSIAEILEAHDAWERGEDDG